MRNIIIVVILFFSVSVFSQTDGRVKSVTSGGGSGSTEADQKTIIGTGAIGDSLRVDTSLIATQYDISNLSNYEVYIDPVNFGATPNNDLDDDTAAFQEAVDSAAINGKVIRPSAGTYHLHEVQLKNNVKFENYGCKFVNNYSGVSTSEDIFSAVGTTGVSTTTTAVPEWGGLANDFIEYYLVVADASIFSVNDKILIEDITIADTLDFIDFNQIRSISNDTLTLYKAANIQDFAIGSTVTKIIPIENITINGGEYIGQSGTDKDVGASTIGGAGFYFSYAENVKINDVTGHHHRLNTVVVEHCFDVQLSNYTSYSNRLYGLNLFKSQAVNMSNTNIHSNGQGGIIMSSLKESNLNNFNITNNGLNTGAGDNIQISRGDQINISNGQLYRSNCYHIWIKGYSKLINVSNVVAKKGTTGAFYLTQEVRDITFTNCQTIENSGGFGIGEATGDPILGVKITNCKVLRDIGNWSVLLQNAKDIIITGNEFINTASTNTVLLTSTVDNIIFKDNIVTGNIINSATNADFGITGEGTTNYIPKWSAAQGLENSVISTNGNFVGINNVTPGASIDAVTSSRGLYLKQTAVSMGTNIYTFQIDNSTHGSNVSAAGPFAIDVASGRALTTTGQGNTGIGIVLPSQRLHVNGNVRITGAIYDSNNQSGTSAQKLSSTGVGTDWIDDTALSVTYDNTTSGLTATNVKAAIDELTATSESVYSNDGTLTSDRLFNTGGFDLTYTDGTTDATTKTHILPISHYTNAEEDYLGIRWQSGNTFSTARYGGGVSGYNAATSHAFYAAANTTTNIGTKVVEMLVDEVIITVDIVIDETNDVRIITGSGTPEGSIVAGIGSTFHRTDGGAGSAYYIKEADTGLSSGWVGK